MSSDLGPVYLLVNCAGTAVAARFEDTPESEVHRMMEANYFGAVNVTRAVLPQMKHQERGRVVFVSSQAALISLYG